MSKEKTKLIYTLVSIDGELGERETDDIAYMSFDDIYKHYDLHTRSVFKIALVEYEIFERKSGESKMLYKWVAFFMLDPREMYAFNNTISMLNFFNKYEICEGAE